jgi:hypothetical protein
MCLVRFWQQTAFISPHSSFCLVFVTYCLHCPVPTAYCTVHYVYGLITTFPVFYGHRQFTSVFTTAQPQSFPIAQPVLWLGDGRLRFDCRQRRANVSSKTSRPCRQTSYAMGTGIKRPKGESDHSPLYSAQIKSEWSCTCTPTYALAVCRGTNVPFV